MSEKEEKVFLISVSLGANGQLIFKSTDDGSPCLKASKCAQLAHGSHDTFGSKSVRLRI